MLSTVETQSSDCSQRGRVWFNALTDGLLSVSAAVPSVGIADGNFGDRPCRFIVVQPDTTNLYPRARNGEVGLLEGWAVAQAVNSIIEVDEGEPTKTAIIAIVDVPSQVYGRREEALGLHLALAASVSAYAKARQGGHPVLALLVGKAMSGAFLAHGYQANRIFTLDDVGVQVHAMGKAAAARVTLRTEQELDQLAAGVPPMAYDLQSYASLGMVEQTIKVTSPDSPKKADITHVSQILVDALHHLNQNDTGLNHRYQGVNRAASRQVRERLKAQWHYGE